MVGSTCRPGTIAYKGRCCEQCPKGKYARSYCSDSSSETQCDTCQHGYYTDTDNLLPKCLTCKECHVSSKLEVKEHCVADRNRQCVCKEGFYCTDAECEHCNALTQCPLGEGVSAQQKGHKSDTKCKSCPAGTFSSVTDAYTPCLTHTSCEDLGREVKHDGTLTSDTVCGDFISRKPSCEDLGREVKHDGTLTSDTVCGDFISRSGYHWILPASLWAGLIVTTFIIITACYLYWRAKCQSRRTVSISGLQVMYPSPAISPNTLQLPAQYDTEKGTEALMLTANICTASSDCLTCTASSDCLECDGATMPTMTTSEKFGQSAAANGHGGNNIGLTRCQSEPQEDEWPGS